MSILVTQHAMPSFILPQAPAYPLAFQHIHICSLGHVAPSSFPVYLTELMETRTIHHLTSERFTYLPSHCCCINLCHLIMAMNKASPSMPRECVSNDNVFELSFFYPEVSHCLLPLRFDIKRGQGNESLCFWSFHFYGIPLSSSSLLIWKKQTLSYHFIYVIFSLYPLQKFMLVQFSHSVMPDSLPPHGLQHARLLCPSLTPGAYSKFMSIKSVMPSNHLILCRPLLCHLQSFPASGSFQMSQFFASGGQSTGVSASASVLPMNSQDWFPLGWTGWISLLSRGLSRLFSNTIIPKHQFFGAQFLQSNSHIHTWPPEKS